MSNHLQQDESLQQQYELLARIWQERHDDIKDEDNISANATISRIISRATSEVQSIEVPARRKRRWSRRRSLIAGLAILIVSAGLLVARNYTASSTMDNPGKDAIVTQKGSRTRTLLADGTIVWLNAGSRLVYENDFNGSTREVRLEGEAFFDVVKQANRPFIVHTSGIDIRVLGTAFNVKSYPEDKNVETTLYRGSVEVMRHEDSAAKAIQLIPNQKLVIAKQAANSPEKLSEGKQPSLKPVSTNDYTITHIDSTKKESERIETAWVYSRLEFRGERFEEVARKLERWYNVKIDFKDEKAKQLPVIGIFETETVEEAFAALKEAFPINYVINNHEISVESSD